MSNMDIIEQTITNVTDPSVVDAQQAEHQLRDLSLGITPLNVGDPRKSGVKCDGCGLPEESSAKKLQICSRCKMVSYCSATCQKAHWKESHKLICSQLKGAGKEEGKRIVEEMNIGDVSSMITLQRSEGAYAVAKKNGLFAAMERLFRMEADGQSPEPRYRCYSWTQEIIINIFKGNREVFDRYTCACPTRSKEYILSSSTAWDNLMDGMLGLARNLNEKFGSESQSLSSREEYECGLAHRAARDAFVTIDLALVHEKVAKAIFFRGTATGKRTPEEARDYALNTLVPKLKAFYRNGGEGFAPDHIDHNQTIQGNIYQFTAMLSYWYKALEVDTTNPNAFFDALQLNDKQEFLYEINARPLGEGMIELGRTLTMDEMRERSLKANKEHQAKLKKKNGNAGGGKKKKGGKKKNRR